MVGSEIQTPQGGKIDWLLKEFSVLARERPGITEELKRPHPIQFQAFST
jgi:hypothetical protein